MHRSLLLAATALTLAHPVFLAAAPAQSNTLLAIPEPGFACPVDLSVRRSNPLVVSQIDTARQHRNSQRIHLSLTPLDNPAIQHAEITVHATSLIPRITPAGTAMSTAVDRTFTLDAHDGIGIHARDLWIDNVATIVSVDLVSLTYIDGTTWHRSAASVCRAIPNGFLPISSR